jgi:hypothetical protein
MILHCARIDLALGLSARDVGAVLGGVSTQSIDHVETLVARHDFATN